MPMNPRASAVARRYACTAPTSLLVAALLAAAPAAARDPQAAHDRIIVFGDSISDSGNYADRAPPGAGRFTTNPDPIWVEHVARELELELELAPRAAGGTNYAEGGARVAVPRPDAPGQLSRRPITEQVGDFLANDGRLSGSSLVILQGGGNDVFATRLNGPADTPADLETLRLAAETLADQAASLLAAGAGTLVTTSVPKFDHYNERYEAALAGRGLNLLYVDMAALVSEIEQSPGEFGIVNTTDRACRGSALESFVCLPEDYVRPDANRTYLYADAVHFTGVVHEIQGDLTLAMWRAPGQLGQLPHLVRASAQAQGQLARDQNDTVHLPGWRLIGAAHAASAGRPAGAHDGRGGLAGLQAGLARTAPTGLSAGVYAGWTAGDERFAGGRGGTQVDNYAFTAFAALHQARFAISVSATAGYSSLQHIERKVALGPVTRIESGSTAGHFIALDSRAYYHLTLGRARISPFAMLRYDRVTVGGYSEAGARSSQVAVADQRLEQLEIGGGIRVSTGGGGKVTPWLEIGYVGDVLNSRQAISILPSGAPLWFASTPYAPADDELVYGAGVSGALGSRASLTFSVRGRQGKAGKSDVYGGMSLSFRV